MDINKIRNMNDEELALFLSKVTLKKTKDCIRCKKEEDFNNTFKILKVENKETFQTKRLCCLCDDCYQKMLEFLNVIDIDWN